MPQLDIYTFPTQIYTIAIIFFFGLLFSIKFLLTSFFKIELLEKEEIYTLDTVFLIKMSQYTHGLTVGKPTDVLATISSSLLPYKTF